MPTPARRRASPPASDSTPFDPARLTRTVVTAALAERLGGARPGTRQDVVIDVNVNYVGGRDGAWERLRELLLRIMPGVEDVSARPGPPDREARWVRRHFQQYVVVSGITTGELARLVQEDAAGTPPDAAAAAARDAARSTPGAAPAAEATGAPPATSPGPTPTPPSTASPAPTGPRSSPHAIYRVWPDFEMRARTTKSIATVKADAAHNAFAAFGEGVVWAVADSGIWGDHPHFARYGTLAGVAALHRSFVDDNPLSDEFGHGTHVAGIIAGAAQAAADPPDPARPAPCAVTMRRPDPSADDEYDLVPVPTICGMAPRARLVSLKVLNATGGGRFSDALAAIEYVQEVNAYGRNLTIHGLNLSAGYPFDPAWFACGQSPLCVEIDRLVRSGVVVVTAAGNAGYGTVAASGTAGASAGLAVTISDPGNADLAITVGSTHREAPHTYGVSFFSSKGPTGDGRLKPDLVAPGERIISCAAPVAKAHLRGVVPDTVQYDYVENSGTSMAAPHVSGVIAAFLSIRREFVGRPDRVKELFLASATDLRRERYFQGAGLVDLMRAIQAA